jgi:phospholipid transport system substrate-binding protein
MRWRIDSVVIGRTTFGLFGGLLSAFAALSAEAQPSVAAPGSPVAVVMELHAGLVAAAADAGLDLAGRHAALQPLVARTHDLEYIARLTIRRQWDELTAEQQQRFVSAFGRLSVMTYASRFANVSSDAFMVLGSEDAGNGRVQVHAAITRADGADVSLDYLLHETGAGWRIVNILADQVSDLALKRAEYQRVLGTGSIDDLLAEIEAQIARLR